MSFNVSSGIVIPECLNNFVAMFQVHVSFHKYRNPTYARQRKSVIFKIRMGLGWFLFKPI